MNTPEQAATRCAYKDLMVQGIQAVPSEKVPELLPCQKQVGSFTCRAVAYLRPSLLTENEATGSRTTPDLRPDAGPCIERLPAEDAEDMLKVLWEVLDPDNEPGGKDE